MAQSAQIPEQFLDPQVLARIENFSLLARGVVEGFVSGLHRSMYHGFGSEFVQYRNYCQGDDLKYVDWKAFARLDKHLTKVFEEETNTNCYLVLDCSASMGYAGATGLSKLHYGKMIAACLAYLMQRQGDNVGFYAYNDQPRATVRPARRSGHVHEICTTLSRLEAAGPCDHARMLGFLGEQFNRRGVVVLISDLLDADEALFRGIRRFRFAHHDCIVVHLLHRDELEFDFAGSVRFVDSESGTELVTAPEAVRDRYRQALDEYRSELARFARQANVDYQLLHTGLPLANVLAAYLHRRESFR